jgi:hypothetical protein
MGRGIEWAMKSEGLLQVELLVDPLHAVVKLHIDRSHLVRTPRQLPESLGERPLVRLR